MELYIQEVLHLKKHRYIKKKECKGKKRREVGGDGWRGGTGRWRWKEGGRGVEA